MKCHKCKGAGEVFVGQIGPDDEGYDSCNLCNGTGVQPTDEEIVELRARAESAEFLLHATERSKDA
jgi:hypothetical protein